MCSHTIKVLAFLAITLRALVPANYMLAPSDDDHFITVVMCTGHGVVETVMNTKTGAVLDPLAEQKPKNSPGEGNAQSPCMFAIATTLWAPEFPAVIAVAFRGPTDDFSLSVTLQPGSGLTAPPPWSTGPPFTA